VIFFNFKILQSLGKYLCILLSRYHIKFQVGSGSAPGGLWVSSGSAPGWFRVRFGWALGRLRVISESAPGEFRVGSG
jgi:hypothetical protein